MGASIVSKAATILPLTTGSFMHIGLSAQKHLKWKVNRNPDPYENGGQPTPEHIYSLLPTNCWEPAVEEVVAIVRAGQSTSNEVLPQLT